MKFFAKTKGAVSIFLILILLPTITIAGLFIDVSRVYLSQEVISSSADLALNTVLSEYDKKLKDYFGLLGSCQSQSDVIDVSKQFFMDSMVSAHVTTSDAEAYWDSVISPFTGDEDIRDMLQLSVEGGKDSINITAAENGALNNPAILKSQIIEFMKYRAPMDGVASLFEKITDSEVSEQAQDADKETKLIEAQKDFADAEKNFVKQAEKTYKAIKAYEDYRTFTGDNFKDGAENYLNKLANFIAHPDSASSESFTDIYKSAHKKMVMDLYNTHSADGMMEITLLKPIGISWVLYSDELPYNDSNKAGASRIRTLVKNFSNYLRVYIEARNTLDKAYNDGLGELEGSDYPIQYWVKLTETCGSAYANYVECAGKLGRIAKKLDNAIENAKEDALDEKMEPAYPDNDYFTYDYEGDNTIKNIYDTLMSYYSDYKTEVELKTGSDIYCQISNTINIHLDTSTNQDKLKHANISNIYSIGLMVKNYCDDFDKAEQLAKNAKDAASKLGDLLTKYKQAFNKWEEIANDTEIRDNELAKKAQEEIEKVKSNNAELFTDEYAGSITKLINRLNNICTLCKTFSDDLKGIKYNNTSIMNVTNYAKFRTAARLDAGRIVINETQLKQYAEESFSFSISDQIQRVIIHDGIESSALKNGYEYIITDSFHPKLNKTKIALYDWLYKKFESNEPKTTASEADTGFNVNDEGSAEDADDKINKKTEKTDDDVDTSEGTSGHSFSEWSGAALPSSFNMGEPEKSDISTSLDKISNFVSGIFSDFKGTFMNALVNMRDDLYMTDYVFSMFTYDTFEKEGCYNCLDDSVKNGLKYSEADEKYKGVIDAWNNSDEIKTLKQNVRNKDNNWAYGGEAEYILYGNKSNAINKTTAYSQIYMLRYALDASAVFRVYWNDEALNTIADALQAFAYIPAIFTKTVACLAITAAEAAVDIAYLKKGIPVVFIKDKEDLICNYHSVFMGDDEKGNAVSDKIALQYSDYLKIFLFSKLTFNNENDIYKRTGDVIQANMSLVSNKKDNFALANANVYFDLKATVIAEPMWSRLLAIDNMGDLSTSKGWRSAKISIRRGY